MTKKDLRIVYMGTPDFAVEPLKRLVENGYNIVGVITMPDKPAGRGHKLQFSAVKQYAVEQGLNILQPEKLKDPEFLQQLKELNADLQVVVAFRMLPEVVWAMPKFGTFNLHASLLPQYRGAAPINWAIINGEIETGVTTFFLTHEIDTGKIIQQERIPISETDNVGIIHDKLMMLGAGLLLQTVDSIIAGTVTAKPQEELYKNESELKPAPKIFKETCMIDWSKSATDIYNLVRGLSPYPAAWSELQTEDGTKLAVKIYETEKELCSHNHEAGKILTDNKTYIKVAAADGYIHLKSLLLPGKKRMQVEELLRGFKIEENSRFVYSRPEI